MSVEITQVSNSYVDSFAPIPVARRRIQGADFQLMGNGLVPEAYDELALSYSGSNLTTVVYKLAGATIATLTLSYSGSNLTGVTRS